MCFLTVLTAYLNFVSCVVSTEVDDYNKCKKIQGLEFKHASICYTSSPQPFWLGSPVQGGCFCVSEWQVHAPVTRMQAEARIALMRGAAHVSTNPAPCVRGAARTSPCCLRVHVHLPNAFHGPVLNWQWPSSGPRLGSRGPLWYTTT